MNRHIAPLALLLAFWLGTAATAQKNPDDAKAALMAGNQRFVAGTSTSQPLGPGVRRTMARGQSPYAIVLCCADSRVPPEHIFNAGLGELFVVRIAGNCVDPEALASIEYAAEHLSTQLLVVLGHERCGAIAAATNLLQQANAGKPQAAESPALQQLLEALEPSVQRAMALDLGGRELTDRAEADNAQSMAVECLRRSPMLRQLQQIGRFQVLPARYHLESGVVDWLPPRALPTETTAAAQPVHAAAPSMAPHVALRLLQAGHRRFLSDGRPIGDISIARRAALTEGQQPFAIVVTCSDSRVPPEHIFDAGLGELFVIRQAGNVLNDDVLASIEYAAAHTGSPLLVVLGHSSCGAVTAAAAHGDDPHLSVNLRALFERLAPAVERARHDGASADDLVALAVRANVQRFVVQARQQSVILRELEHQGRFTMLPAVYDLPTGDIEWLKEASPGDSPAAMPAPAGESAPHGSAHDAQDHDAGVHGAPAHGAVKNDAATHGAPAHGVPPHGAKDLDWADEPSPGHDDPHGTGGHAAPTRGADSHDAAPGGAAADPHAGQHHDAADHSDHEPSGQDDDEHGGAEHAEHTDHPAPAAAGGSPVLALGIAGMVSLAIAAGIALKGRS